MSLKSFSTLLAVLVFSLTACRKDTTNCSDEIIVGFDGAIYKYNEDGFPTSYFKDGAFINNSYGGDNSTSYAFNSEGLPTKIVNSFDGGYGWHKSTYDWNFDTCNVTFEQEGPFEPTSIRMVINEKRELLEYGNYRYYYHQGRLDSIIGEGSVPKRYFVYSGDLLTAINSYSSEGEWIFSSSYAYDDQGKLVAETLSQSGTPEAPNSQELTWYVYGLRDQLREISYEKYLYGDLTESEKAVVEQNGCGLPLSLDPLSRMKFGYFSIDRLSF